MAIENFTNNLKSASDYINTGTIDIPTGADIDLNNGTVTPQTTSFSIKELICSLLAGNGLKLPNLQICLKVNIGSLLNTAGIDWQGPLAGLKGALDEIDNAMDDFIAHTNIDNVLGRINDAIAEFAAIANMINFCGTPVMPRPIPNMLGDIMGSFTGPGKDMLDGIGTMLDSDIGGCLGDGGFNPNLFTSGILGEIGDNWDDFINGRVAQATIDRWASELRGLAKDLKDLIEFENNFGKGSTESSNGAGTGGGGGGQGGSTFAPVNNPQHRHTGVGTSLGDIDSKTFSDAQKTAGSIKYAFDQTKDYDISQDGSGVSLWTYLLEPEIIAKLEGADETVVDVTERQPVYDYCGKQIGYTDVPIQQPTFSQSLGGERIISNDPGQQGIAQANVVVATSPSTTTNLNAPAPSISTVPTRPIGKDGDRKGAIASDDSYMYYCRANYDGVSNIWVRSILDTWIEEPTPEPTPEPEPEQTDTYIESGYIHTGYTE